MNFPFDDWPYNDNNIPSELRNFNENEIPFREDLMAAVADRRFISLVFDGHSGNEDSDEEEDGEEEETYEEDEDDEEYVPDVPPASRVSHEPPRNPISDEVIVIPDDERQNSIEDERNKRRRTEAGEASCSSIPIESAECSQDNDYRTDIDGLICPICMDAWTDNGDHHVWCHH
jgi:E3 ubiquitin-protein ligase RFWD3